MCTKFGGGRQRQGGVGQARGEVVADRLGVRLGQGRGVDQLTEEGGGRRLLEGAGEQRAGVDVPGRIGRHELPAADLREGRAQHELAAAVGHPVETETTGRAAPERSLAVSSPVGTAGLGELAHQQVPDVALDRQRAVGEIVLAPDRELEDRPIARHDPVGVVVVTVVAVRRLLAVAAALEQAALQHLQRDAAALLGQRRVVELVEQERLARLVVLVPGDALPALLDEALQPAVDGAQRLIVRRGRGRLLLDPRQQRGRHVLAVVAHRAGALAVEAVRGDRDAHGVGLGVAALHASVEHAGLADPVELLDLAARLVDLPRARSPPSRRAR